jgi:hypothetical protein
MSKMLTCKFCSKECKNANSLRNHERLCKSNPDRQISTFEIPGFHSKFLSNKKNSNQYIKAKETGVDYIMSDETRLKKSIASKSQIWDDERRNKHSVAMIQAVKNNPDSYTSSNVCGRIKIEDYTGERFHGKWEVIVAKWFDDNDIHWVRRINPFEYYWNNSTHLYFPDFYLPNYDMYVEVKGYEIERDKCKWSAVPNLIIIKKNEIKLIKENKYVLLAQR